MQTPCLTAFKSKTINEQYQSQIENIALGVAKSKVWRALSNDERHAEIALTHLLNDKLSTECYSKIITITMNRIWGYLSEEDQRTEIALNLIIDIRQFKKTRKHYATLGVAM
jgi:isoleucyl-tRNA synthetase